jgi:hypothetical protein
MKAQSMWFFYAVWVVVCLLSFASSTLLGCITIAIGVMIRLLEIGLNLLREIRNELRINRLELRAQRLKLPPEP